MRRRIEPPGLEGSIPPFDFANLGQFNVSGNNLSGPIPKGGDRLGATRFFGNLGLCGKPLPVSCPPVPPPKTESKGRPMEQAIMYSGYIALGLALVLVIIFMVVRKKKGKGKNKGKKSKSKKSTTAMDKGSSGSSDFKTSRSEYSTVVERIWLRCWCPYPRRAADLRLKYQVCNFPAGDYVCGEDHLE